MADEQINQLLAEDTTGVDEAFTFESIMSDLYQWKQESDTTSKQELENIERLIYEGTDIAQADYLKDRGYDEKKIPVSPTDNWNLNKEFSEDLTSYGINWDLIESKFGFSRINPSTNAEWTSVNELWDFYNVRKDISNTNIDPTHVGDGSVGQDSHWDHYTFSDNLASKYPRIVGSDLENHKQGINGRPQDNPYYYLTSAYIAGGGVGAQEYDKTSDEWLEDPHYNSLEANVAMNMFRFEIEELTPSNFNKFYGSNRQTIQNDSFHPLANVGDYETEFNGLTVAPYVSGYIASKYNELNQMVLDEGGHYIYQGIEKDGVYIGKEEVFIPQPELFHSGADTFEKTVQRVINLSIKNEGLTQGDFISKFGPTHELMGIFNSGNANTTGLSSQGTDIRGHSFYAEESIPGFYNLYSAGNSMLALGLNFDPTSNEIQSIRFGNNFPTPGGESAKNLYGLERPNGMHYYGIRNMVGSYVSDYIDIKEDEKGFSGRMSNVYLPLEETGLLPEWQYDITPYQGPGYGSSKGSLGTNAYFGFDVAAQGQLFLASIHEDGYVDPKKHFFPSFGEKEYSKYTIGRGRNPHTLDMRSGGGSFFNDGLPNFSNSLAYKMSSTQDFQNSNNLAYEQGEISFKKFLVHVLQNASSDDYYIDKSFQDLVEYYEIILYGKDRTRDLLDEIQEINDTRGPTLLERKKSQESYPYGQGSGSLGPGGEYK